MCCSMSDDVWDSRVALGCLLPCNAQYLATAWELRCQCEHKSGAMLSMLLSPFGMGRDIDGIIAMADR